jgi:hypothetical protein
MAKRSEVPPHMMDTYDMLVCGFSTKIEEKDYLPILAVLHRDMSFRSIATILCFFTEKDYYEIYMDASGFYPTDVTSEDIARVIEILTPCDYYNWRIRLKMI